MNIQLKSDLHWEHEVHQTRAIVSAEKDSAYVSPEADVLVLAGDMINATESHIDYLSYKFKDVKIPILYVPGNHEYWHQNYTDARNLLKKKLFCSNIKLLDPHSIIIKDKDEEEVLFVGATVWTNLSNPMKAMIAQRTRDFQNIKGISVDSWTNKNIEEIAYIEKILNYEDFHYMKKVVITHYLPSYRSVPSRFLRDDANCIFVATDMERVIHECQPDLMLHGHTHDSNDYLIGKTRVVSNPKGRWFSDFNGLNPTYNNEFIITI